MRTPVRWALDAARHPIAALLALLRWPTVSRIVPLGGATAADRPGSWHVAGREARFRLEGLPAAWLELRIRGHARPACSLTVELGAGGRSRGGPLALGALGEAASERRVVVDARGGEACLVVRGGGGGEIELALVARRITGLEVLVRAFRAYRRRVDRRHHGLAQVVRKTLRILRSSGVDGLRVVVTAQLTRHQADAVQYALWIERHALDVAEARAHLERLRSRPTFSIVVPVYEPDEPTLRRCLDSVRGQLYPDWELCLADDASRAPHVRRILDEYAAADPRVKVVYRERNGHIAAASNSALALSGGELVALLDQDDELAPDALLECAAYLEAQPDTDLLYTDEDKLDERGRRYDPHFKPDWSPETLLGGMYLGHLLVLRRSAVTAVGAFREGYDGSQDYDLALRVTERSSRVGHVPKVLYHWRALPGSAAGDPSAKPYAYAAAVRALEDALRRRSIPGTVEPVDGAPGRYVVRYAVRGDPTVSIIIPTRDRADLLGRCLASVFARTEYPRFAVCVVDNGSTERATSELLGRWRGREPRRFSVVRHDVPFNYPALVNVGARATDGDLLVLLNNDTEVRTPTWLTDMAGYACQPEIGAVGCVLVYPNSTVQHAGLIFTGDGTAACSHAGVPGSAAGHSGRLLTQSTCSAVTAACLMVRRELFERVDGFDESLPFGLNDVDFCLRLGRLGRRTVCLGNVRLLHHESASRPLEVSGVGELAVATRIMRERYGALLDRDPYYNPNLRANPPDFSLALD